MNEKTECDLCKKKFDGNDFSSLCENCRRKKHSKFYRTISIIILIVGLVTGIVSGNQYKTVDSNYDEKFNVAIMLYVWIASAISTIFTFAIYSICYRLDLMIDKDTNK